LTLKVIRSIPVFAQ